jgi:hypothetical protein
MMVGQGIQIGAADSAREKIRRILHHETALRELAQEKGLAKAKGRPGGEGGLTSLR